MSDRVRVAVDAMGGDHAPGEIVKGAVDAVLTRTDIEVILVGMEDRVKEELSKYTYPQDQVRVVHASEVIATEEPPVMAIRKKKMPSYQRGAQERFWWAVSLLSEESKELSDLL